VEQQPFGIYFQATYNRVKSNSRIALFSFFCKYYDSNGARRNSVFHLFYQQFPGRLTVAVIDYPAPVLIE
jgi:hypothetical protein